jgi:hypothetical protein
MIVVPEPPDLTLRLWTALFELSALWFPPRSWTLIGAQMVALHAYERNREPPRSTRDADILVDARLTAVSPERFCREISRLGYALEGVSPEGIGHRFSRKDVSLDILAPDGMADRSPRIRTVGKVRTVRVPGGTQSLTRSGDVSVQVGGAAGSVPRPNLLGAILLKARAVDVSARPAAQLEDLACLLSLVDDPLSLARCSGPPRRVGYVGAASSRIQERPASEASRGKTRPMRGLPSSSSSGRST